MISYDFYDILSSIVNLKNNYIHWRTTSRTCIEIEDLSILDIDKRGGEKKEKSENFDSNRLKLCRTGYIKLHFLARPTGTTFYEKNNFDALCATICKHARGIVWGKKKKIKKKEKNSIRFTEKSQS